MERNEEIFNFVKTFELDENDGFCDGDDMDLFLSSIDRRKVPSFDFESGASKLVIIPDDRDYVIKIPFNGGYQWDWDNDRYFFEPFNGADDDGDGNDYCAAEMKLYDRAVEEGYAEFFVAVEYAGDINGYPIYTQKRVKDFCKYISDEEQKSYSSATSRTSLNSTHIGRLPYYWAAACLTVFEEDLQKFNAFIDFLRRTDIIKDLHTGNLGFLNNKPVIVDYGGWYD